MARLDVLPVAAPASVAVGASTKLPESMRDVYVHIFGTFVASMSVEVSIDGTNFTALTPAVTVPGFVSIPMPAKKVRVNTTAFTSGVPSAVVGGRYYDA